MQNSNVKINNVYKQISQKKEKHQYNTSAKKTNENLKIGSYMFSDI